ncbi:MAG TPA: hypothetical protein ACFCUY_15365 [Xenococcaceae cyanobacterium]
MVQLIQQLKNFNHFLTIFTILLFPNNIFYRKVQFKYLTKNQNKQPYNNIYLPFFYLEKVKRVGEKYFLKVILWEDLSILFFAFGWQTSDSFITLICLVLLLSSFWCIYEYGYYENDLVAEKYEAEPKLSENYYKAKFTITWWQPWIWAIILSIFSAIILSFSQIYFNHENLNQLVFNHKLSNLVLFYSSYWLGFLLISRLCFWIYNYVNKKTRIWLYIVLQVCRYCGFLIILPTNLIGISLLFGHILSRTIGYIVYRYSGGVKSSWPKNLPEQFLRLVLFICLLFGITLTTKDFSLVTNWQTLIISVWCLFKARKQIKEIVINIKPIWQDSSNNLSLPRK